MAWIDQPTQQAHHVSPSALDLDPVLMATGFGVAGVLDAATYDALVPQPWRTQTLLPTARSALVLSTGGSAFGDALRSGAVRPSSDPIDGLTAAVVSAAAESLEASGAATAPLYYWEQQGGQFADFVALGAACGIGAPSRLGILLHPVFGPWIAIRAVLLTAREMPPTVPLRDTDPCGGCPAPCAHACPGAAVLESGFDVDACTAKTRTYAACREQCAARRACVIGPEHAYHPDIERQHRAEVVRFISR